MVFKKNAVYRGRYVGPPNIWEFDPYPGEAGALSQEVIVNIGTEEAPRLMFLGERSFYLYDGTRPVPVGVGQVNEAVTNTLLQSRAYACNSLHDKANSRVYFYYPVGDSVFPDHCVVYNYRTNQWGVDDRVVTGTTMYIQAGITYAGLGGQYARYDNLPNLSYATAFLGASLQSPAIINTSNQLQTLTGASGATGFTTGDIGTEDFTTVVTRITPRFLTQPTSASLTNYSRMNMGDALEYGSVQGWVNGNFDFLKDAHWHRLQWDLVGPWEMAVFSADYEEAGLE